MQVLTQRTWTARLLQREAHDWWTITRAGATGLTLSACFGLALGARYGAAAMAVGALGVPLGLGAVVVLGGPALYIGVAHAGLPLSSRALGSALASAVCIAGLVLGGLAPAITLVSVSVDTALGAAAAGIAGLLLATLLAMKRLLRDIAAHLDGQEGARGARWATFAFASFGVLLAARIWWVTIPMLGRGAL